MRSDSPDRRGALGSLRSAETTVPWVLVLACLASVLAITGPPPAVAGSCTVPSASYPTLQSALDDPTCDPVLLGGATYIESPVIERSVTLEGQSSAASVIEGQITISAGAVVLNALTVTTDTADLRGRFQHALEAGTGARVSGVDLNVVHRALLFGDGFENGTTTSWSVTTP